MDCASEEQLVRWKLEGATAVRSLGVDLRSRTVDVLHEGDHREILRLLESLKLGAELASTGPAEERLPADDAPTQTRLLRQVLSINLLFFFVEIIAGFLAGSMGLIADSLDMLADAIVYGLSLMAVKRSSRFKKNIAGASGYFQLVLAVLGLLEVVRRFAGREDLPAFEIMIGISFVALVGNAVSLYLLQKSKSTEAHMQASMIFTSNDVIANVGVIVAGALVYLTNSKIPDLVVGIAIFAIVGRGALRILRLARVRPKE